MEDILQRVIQEIKTYGDLDGIEDIRPLGKAIENLIARNKELEEENEKYESAVDYLQTLNHKYYEDNVTLLRKNGNVEILFDDIHFKYIDDVNNYISKLKVREKIEEYSKLQEEMTNKNHQANNINDCYKYGDNAQKAYYKKEALQELLQEGDDK